MKYLIQLAILVTLIGCQTGRVINNAKPPVDGKEAVNNIAIAAETATRTWIPWYILIVTILIIVAVKTWKEKES